MIENVSGCFFLNTVYIMDDKPWHSRWQKWRTTQHGFCFSSWNRR